MQPAFLHDKTQIEQYLRRNPYLHLYALGDLDDFFWPYTCWIGSPATPGDSLDALFLIYAGTDLPIVLVYGEAEGKIRDLLRRSLHLLPRRFYLHISPGLVDLLEAQYTLEPHGHYWIMGLTEPGNVDEVNTAGVEVFTPDDAAALQAFYDSAHPGNWFDPRMLETGQYYGVRQQGAITSVAGIHVYSPRYGVAALGNIVTRPDCRGQGLGTRVTARLCQELRKTTPDIGLNVRAGNIPAIRAYTRLGFTKIAEYDEYMVES